MCTRCDWAPVGWSEDQRVQLSRSNARKNLFVLNQTLRSFEVIEPQLTLRDLVPGLHEKCTKFMIDMGLNISYFSGRKKTRRNIDEHANELELW